MDDLISRQAAIDAIESHLRTAEEPYYLSDTDKIMNHAFEVAASCVYNLPSAEPEIIRCKNCIWFDRYTDGIEKYQWDGFCAEWARNTYENWYCGRAERR